uniref:Uncharacterized protein n=1 Tax=Globisporangium ultimum (strain ATCC 200006 / CBS 805.95 / DAOM BR144) TaxID=431595 RepID=K3X0I3_GLOUD
VERPIRRERGAFEELLREPRLPWQACDLREHADLGPRHCRLHHERRRADLHVRHLQLVPADHVVHLRLLYASRVVLCPHVRQV